MIYSLMHLSLIVPKHAQKISEELYEIRYKFVTLQRTNTIIMDLYRIVCRSKSDETIFIWNKGRHNAYLKQVGNFRSLLTLCYGPVEEA
jgi:hypothetical protein